MTTLPFELRIELALIAADCTVHGPQTKRIKQIADRLLNNESTEESLIKIYLANDDEPDEIQAAFNSFLEQNSILVQFPQQAAWVLLYRAMLGVVDQSKNPEQQWHTFASKYWSTYEYVCVNSNDFALSDMLYLAMMYNYQIQQFVPKLTAEEENLKFAELQQALRSAARKWLTTNWHNIGQVIGEP